MKDIEVKEGDLHKVILPLVNEHGQIETGRKLGVSAATINKWLKRHGYTAKVIYIKRESAKGQDHDNLR
jgi:hypothetical protein